MNSIEPLLQREQYIEELRTDNARLCHVLQKVEAYLSSEESPLYSLWENGDICDYDDTPRETWEDVLAELRDANIPADCLGYGAGWPAVTLYREILAALQDGTIKENAGNVE